MFGLEIWQIWAVVGITLFAGFVKGAVGFAMPMIMMSAFGSILPATTALALLILPTLATNLAQAVRDGPRAAWAAVVEYRWHIGAVILFIGISALFATRIPQAVMYALLGVPIALYAGWQLAGKSLVLPIHHRRRAEIATGIIGGLYGGVSGIWGPPLIVFLISIGAGKAEQMRVQGVVFLIGAVVLLFAHLQSGVLNAQTLPLSALITIPGLVGMTLGYWLHDRLDVDQFRRWTLIMLMLSAANLVRRAVELAGWI